MKTDFLLNGETAKTLYAAVRDLPIIDYHNHLSISEILENRRFLNVYDLWIAPDPYKHRAMRMCGVPEKYITGDATKEEKFVKWGETLPKLLLNPLSHWSAVELEKIFGVTEYLNGDNAQTIYAQCNEYLQTHEVTVNSLLDLFRVEYACPCASLTDDVSGLNALSRFAPSLRGDDVVAVSAAFLAKLEERVGRAIETLADFESAVEELLVAFKAVGCRYSDHALDNGFAYFVDDGKNAARFADLKKGALCKEKRTKFSSYVLCVLAKLYAKHGFVMQLHIGAQRYTSSKLREKAGAAGGFASIGNSVDVSALTTFLDEVDRGEYGLPKTVLFTLNPADNALVSVLAGSYAKDGVSGLITQGPAWWWCDHKQGMLEMFENAAVFSALFNFVGMTTDSRSFLSFVRHDYFRRVLCDWLGEKWEKGELFCDLDGVMALAKKLCYDNAKNTVKI